MIESSISKLISLAQTPVVLYIISNPPHSNLLKYIKIHFIILGDS
jgi:hypothetical protein